MIAVVLIFLFLSILFYLAFGGADFGVGIIELFSGKKNQSITKKAGYRIIGPVWEANHIWMIITIVLMWIAFPSYYNIIVTQLHIPLSLLLIAIIGRGTAFIFRHYDAYEDGSQKLYDFIFRLSSFFAPFFVGVTAGALISGNIIHPDAIGEVNFYEAYIQTWFNPFAILVGVFVVALAGFIAAIFIVGETVGEVQTYYMKKASHATFLAMATGTAIFLEAFISEREFIQIFFDSWIAPLAFALVSLILIPIWSNLRTGKKNSSRILLGAQLFLMLGVWVFFSFPNLIIFKSGDELSILDQLPPDSVFNGLGWALLSASVFVLPGLYHLFKTFGLIGSRPTLRNMDN